MTINDLLTLLCEEMAEEDVPDVLHQPLTLAALWADLARLAGEPLPRWVAAAVAEAGRVAAWVLLDAGAEVRR